MLSERILGIKPSATLRIKGLADELRAAGVDVLDFSVGEPDFPTPATVKQAGKTAIDDDRTHYTANEGIPELREAISSKLREENGLSYGTDQILVSPGAKASLNCAAMALFGPGDEVLIPRPYWVTYPEQVRLAGATPVFVDTSEEDGFRLRPERLEEACTPSTKAIILNYPSNPTGSCYDREELEAIAEAILRRNLVVVSDEIYEKLVYDGRSFTSLASLGPEIASRTVVINGLSKSFAMTGWRLGYAAGPRELIQAMAKVQGHTTSHPSSITQWAGVRALREAGDAVQRMKRAFAERRAEIVEALERIPGVSCAAPDGAFYVFPNVSAFFGRTWDEITVRSGEGVARVLLERANVAVVPGEAFGSTSHIRISYACSVETIRKGMGRIADVLA